MSDLGQRWGAARPPVAGIHLDSAACARQSLATIDAATAHARHEAEIGGYVAAAAAEPVLHAGRAAVAALVEMAPADVVFTTGANHALDLLLGAWPGLRTLACLPGEYGPNLALMAAHGFAVRALPADGAGRLIVEEATRVLAGNPPALVHLTALASHRGTAQPLAELATECRRLGVPLIVDAAQALGHLDCAVGADAVYSSSRKWLAGPRGVGVLAIRPELAERLQPRLPPPHWPVAQQLPVLARLAPREANVAAQVGFSLAVGEHVEAGPAAVRSRLAAVGRRTREALAGVTGWRICEPADEPTAITTLAPTDGADPVTVRAWLITEHRIVTTVAGVERAPFELRAPVLRLSPHIDCTTEDLKTLVTALASFGR